METEQIKDIIEQNYDIRVQSLEKIKNAYKVKTSEGYECFKISKYDYKQFKFIVEAMNYLKSAGFESVLPLYTAFSGESFITVDGGYALLCPWIESREASFKNPVELKMCVETLSSLHLFSRGFRPSKESRIRKYYGRWAQKFRKRCNELLYFKASIMLKDKLSEFDSLYLKYFDMHYRQALKSVRDLEASGYFSIMEKQKRLLEICHHDSANHNFLITPDFKMFMIDFDYCIQDSHLHDLGSIIIRNMKYGSWDFDTMDFILDIYQEKIPVERKELYMIFCFMQFPQDFWQVGLQYYVEKQPWGEEFFLKKLTRIVEDSRDRMDFLRDFESSFMEG